VGHLGASQLSSAVSVTKVNVLQDVKVTVGVESEAVLANMQMLAHTIQTVRVTVRGTETHSR